MTKIAKPCDNCHKPDSRLATNGSRVEPLYYHIINLETRIHIMANLMDMLKGQLTPATISQLAQHIGGVDESKTQNATTSAMALLIGALQKQASTPEGAQSLNHALERDHQGSVLNNVMELFGGNTEHLPNKTTDGLGILSHLLGNKRDTAAAAIGQQSGLDTGQVMKLLVTVAPLVMGALGKKKQEQNMGTDMLQTLLGSEAQQVRQQESQLSPFLSLLDQDGDGSVADDVLNMGKSMLGGFFKK